MASKKLCDLLADARQELVERLRKADLASLTAAELNQELVELREKTKGVSQIARDVQKEAEAEIAPLKTAATKKRNQRQAAEEDIKSAGRKRERAQVLKKETIPELNREIKSLNAQLKVAREKADSELAPIREELASVRKDLRSVKLKNDNLSEANISKKKEKLQQEVLEKMQELSSREFDLQQRKSEVGAALNPLLKARSEARARLRKSNEELSFLTDPLKEIERLESAIDSRREKLESVGVEKRTLAKVLKEKNTNLKEVKSSLDKTLKDLNRAVERELKAEEQLLEDININKIALKFSDLPKQTQKEIEKLTVDFNKAPVGSYQRELVHSEMMLEISKVKDINMAEFLEANWKGNLFGFSTLMINGYSGSLNILARNIFHFARLPAEGKRAYANILLDEISTTANTLARVQGLQGLKGKDKRALEKFQTTSVLEALHQTEQFGITGRSGLKTLSVVSSAMFRGLSSGDGYLNGITSQLGAVIAANQEIQQNRDKSKTYGQQLGEMLHNSTEEFDAALAEAQAEFGNLNTLNFDQTDVLSRAFQIIQDKRDPYINNSARAFADRLIFMQEPEGTLGALARVINSTVETLSVGRFRPVAYVAPFVNTITNVANAFLDFDPIIALGRTGNDLVRHYSGDPDVDLLRAQERVFTGMLGGAVAGSLLAAALSSEEDENGNKSIDIFGSLSNVPFDQRRAAGIRAFSVRIRTEDDQFLNIPFNETPFAFALGVIGQYLDARREGRVDEDPEISQKLAFEIANSWVSGLQGVVRESTAIKPYAELLQATLGADIFTNRTSFYEKGLLATEAAGMQLTKITSGMLIPQGLLNNINKLVGDEVVKSNYSPLERVFGRVPYVTELGAKPALGVFGDVVRRGGAVERVSGLTGLDRVAEFSQIDDPDISFIVTQGVFPPRITNSIPKQLAPEFDIGGGKKVDENGFTRKERKEARLQLIRELKALRSDSLKETKQEDDSGKKVDSPIGQFGELGRVAFNLFDVQDRYRVHEIAGPKYRRRVAELRQEAASFDSTAGAFTRKELRQKLRTAFSEELAASKAQYLEELIRDN